MSKSAKNHFKKRNTYVLDYLKDAPYPGAIQAIALAGRDTLIYMVNLRNDTVDVYRHVFRGNKADIQE